MAPRKQARGRAGSTTPVPRAATPARTPTARKPRSLSVGPRVAGRSRSSSVRSTSVISFKSTPYLGLIAFIIGSLFGVSLVHSGILYGDKIIEQFSFQHFRLLQFVLAAAATTSLLFALATFVTEDTKFTSARKAIVRYYDNRGYVAVILGGVLIGSGIALSGHVPGSAVATLGLNSATALWTVVGLVGGSVLFFYIQPWLDETVYEYGFFRVFYADRFFGLSFPVLTLIQAALLYTAVIFMYFNESIKTDNIADIAGLYKWKYLEDKTTLSALLATIPVGIAQILSVMFFNETISSMHGFFKIAAEIRVLLGTGSKLTYTYLRPGRWWYVIFLVGIVFGSVGSFYYYSPGFSELISSAGYSDSTTTGERVQIVLGGVLLAIGSGMANGGPTALISGISALSIPAYIALITAGASGWVTLQILASIQ